jgi:hypothetical protein
MKKERFSLLGMFLLAAVLVAAVAISAAAPSVSADQATDYFQRHPEASISSVGSVAGLGGSDYYQLQRMQTGLGSSRPKDTTDYFMRQSAIASVASAISAAPSTDYFQRLAELKALSVGSAVDLSGSDYYQRQPAGLWSSRPLDTTDYYMRHPGLKLLADVK